jgi:hypothetical protein
MTTTRNGDYPIDGLVRAIDLMRKLKGCRHVSPAVSRMTAETFYANAIALLQKSRQWRR